MHQIYFINYSITEPTILFVAAHFDNLPNFHKNLDKIYFSIPLQKYDSKYQPKNYYDFINIETVVWNKFLIQYKELFHDLDEENLDRLFSICNANDSLVKLLVSDSYRVNLETRIEIIKSKINEDSKFIYNKISRLFNTNHWINFAAFVSKFDA
ncbi:hypothetical protein [Rickettsia endosymbiont of Pantilius tunicatus]|uniref:hypothetical protein n=1 Tax=Rickettsia endosymbiont of Pantilius tunicatus TaxID=3066267 RepID=UPI00376EBE85